jgi:hypothetical protein
MSAIRDNIGGHFGEEAAKKALRELEDGGADIEFLGTVGSDQSGFVLISVRP